MEVQQAIESLEVARRLLETQVAIENAQRKIKS